MQPLRLPSKQPKIARAWSSWYCGRGEGQVGAVNRVKQRTTHLNAEVLQGGEEVPHGDHARPPSVEAMEGLVEVHLVERIKGVEHCRPAMVLMSGKRVKARCGLGFAQCGPLLLHEAQGVADEVIHALGTDLRSPFQLVGGPKTGVVPLGFYLLHGLVVLPVDLKRHTTINRCFFLKKVL